MTASPPLALVARDVTRRVRDGRDRRTILEGISLEVARGEHLVLRGPSGSGKTTLLALLGGMLSPTAGEILLDGEATARLRDHHRAEIRRKKVGFVFQDLQLIEDISVIDNVLLPAVPDGVDSSIRGRARSLLERFGIHSLATSPARALSGGERQRVAMARALIHDPSLLLLDEPTAHLDDERVEVLLGEVGALFSEGRAVVVATHDARWIQRARGARVLNLVGGRIVEHPEGESGC